MRAEHQSASCLPHTGDGASNLGMSPDQESDQQPFGAQEDAQLSHTGQGCNALLFLIKKKMLGKNTPKILIPGYLWVVVL